MIELLLNISSATDILHPKANHYQPPLNAHSNDYRTVDHYLTHIGIAQTDREHILSIAGDYDSPHTNSAVFNDTAIADHSASKSLHPNPTVSATNIGDTQKKSAAVPVSYADNSRLLHYLTKSAEATPTLTSDETSHHNTKTFIPYTSPIPTATRTTSTYSPIPYSLSKSATTSNTKTTLGSTQSLSKSAPPPSPQNGYVSHTKPYTDTKRYDTHSSTTHHAEIMSLYTKLGEIRTENKGLSDKNRELSTQYHTLHMEDIKIKSENDRLSRELKKAEEALSLQEQKIAALNIELSKLNGSHSALEEQSKQLTQELASTKEMILVNNRKMESLKQELSTLKKRHQELSIQNELLTAEIEKLTESNHMLQKDHETLSQENSNLQHQYDSTEQENNSLHNQTKDQSNIIGALNQEIEIQKQKKETLSAELATSDAALKAKIQEIELSKTQMIQLTSSFAAQNEEMETLKESLANSQKALDITNREMESLRATLVNSQKALAARNEERETLDTEVEMLKSALAIKDKTIGTLKEKLSQSTDRERTLHEDIEFLRAEQLQFQDALGLREQIIQTLEEEIKKINLAHQQSDKIQTEAINSLKDQLVLIKRALNAQNQENLSLEQKLQFLSSTVGAQKTTEKCLHDEIKSLMDVNAILSRKNPTLERRSNKAIPDLEIKTQEKIDRIILGSDKNQNFLSISVGMNQTPVDILEDLEYLPGIDISKKPEGFHKISVLLPSDAPLSTTTGISPRDEDDGNWVMVPSPIISPALTPAPAPALRPASPSSPILSWIGAQKTHSNSK